jgi:hypothetical protein
MDQQHVAVSVTVLYGLGNCRDALFGGNTASKANDADVHIHNIRHGPGKNQVSLTLSPVLHEDNPHSIQFVHGLLYLMVCQGWM